MSNRAVSDSRKMHSKRQRSGLAFKFVFESAVVLLAAVAMIGRGAVVVASAPQSGVESLAKNGGFELSSGQLPVDWIFEKRVAHKGTVSLQREFVHSGLQGLALTPNKNNVEALLPLAVGQAFPVAPFMGKRMHVSGWIGAKGPAKAVIGLFAIDMQGRILSEVRLTQGSDQSGLQFHEGTLDVSASTGTALLILSCSVEGTSGSVYFDDVSLSAGEATGETPQAACGATWELDARNPAKINTAGWADSPFISLDGKLLYFTYTPWSLGPVFLQQGSPLKSGPDRPGHRNNSNPWEDSDIYMATRNADGSWGVPENLPFNDRYSDCCAMSSYDGKRIYFNKTQAPGSKHVDIFVVAKNSDGSWGKPESIGPPINVKGWSASNPHASKDEKTIYFTSDRPGGFGKNDIWVSTKKADGKWSTPSNLGMPINSAEEEDQFWLSPDGTVAYFNRGPRIAIYRSEFKDSKWSNPVKVDFGQLAMAAEASLTEDGKRIYFASFDECRRTLSIMYAERLANGAWGVPKRVD